MGQFLTPAPIAKLMASMFSCRPRALRVLDAGAGVGSLSAALVAQVCRWVNPPKELAIIAYEVEPLFVEYLLRTFNECGAVCRKVGIRFTGEVRTEDFIAAAAGTLQGRELFPGDRATFNAAILNPPYRKINSDSRERHLLRAAGIETSNLYTAFVWLAELMMDEGGELVAITPRSFCNGPYFRPFRQALMRSMTFRRVHVFESRDAAFAGDEVLQENVIIHAAKVRDGGKVTVTSSHGPDDPDVVTREISQDQFVAPHDPDSFFHIVPDEIGHAIGEQMRGLTATLQELRLAVSTGRVVDFRSKPHLRLQPESGTVPLIYPGHLVDGRVVWPNPKGRKPNALSVEVSDDLLLPADFYVLVKRVSAKEERRRVVAAVYDPGTIETERIAFENHLNYYHRNGGGLPRDLARGLATFLNSTLVDSYFRQFNGHTQVNAADLRSFRYPDADRLARLGVKVGDTQPDQEALDLLVREEIFGMTDGPDPIAAKKKIDDALAILKALDVPREQQNERSALTLLALLDVNPSTKWAKAGSPLRGITEMMDYFREHFGKSYAPNSRETVRRFTVHQFVQMGLVRYNPDNPKRPVNSPDARYQIDPDALATIRTYRTREWRKALEAYMATAATIRTLHPAERCMSLIPVTLPDGATIDLTAGGQNVLVKDILEKFCPAFTPGARVVYVGDAGVKWKLFDAGYLAALGVTVDEHGKMPDVVIHDTKRNWLILIEAVTSHGPVSIKRHNELKAMFKGSTAGLVFVTAFESRRAMLKYLGDIAWETEVWVAEAPTHLIHFNGERFLGPYGGGAT